MMPKTKDLIYELSIKFEEIMKMRSDCFRIFVGNVNIAHFFRQQCPGSKSRVFLCAKFTIDFIRLSG